MWSSILHGFRLHMLCQHAIGIMSSQYDVFAVLAIITRQTINVNVDSDTHMWFPNDSTQNQ